MTDTPVSEPASTPKPSDTTAETTAAALPEIWRPQPPLWLSGLAVVCWWVILTAHYLLCGRIAYAIGNPVKLWSWLEPWDELLMYSISGGWFFTVAVTWFAVVGGLFLLLVWGGYELINLLQRWLARDRRSAFEQATISVWPLIVLSLLSLLILAIDNPKHDGGESGLEVSEQLTYQGFVEYQFLSLVGMLIIGTLFGGLAVAVAFFMWIDPHGGTWQLIVAILFGIAVAMCFGFVIGPWSLKLPELYGPFQAVALFQAGGALLCAIPGLWLVRSGKSR